MEDERYPGEHRGLRLFLEDICPIVEAQLGPDCLLHHAIRRACATGRLDHLRHARRLFNRLPRAVRLRLSEALLHKPEPAPEAARLLAACAERQPARVVAFTAPRLGWPAERLDVGMEETFGGEAELQVLIRPGTLPRTAAGTLRRIADMVERDRRLLSDRYWRTRPIDTGDADEQAG